MKPQENSEPSSEFVSLARLKDAARRLLPDNSTTRAVILGEKDVLPLREALAKFEVFDRLLASELGP